ncbi:MAG TPA: cyclopropane-fatty-acyl-phospholipid synthase family protein [Dermatophilaceae bacterium]|nr:cyclopropane-fatty-acyl-phospholipid synthase family protein [Dermatophilaceae bacterium]
MSTIHATAGGGLGALPHLRKPSGAFVHAAVARQVFRSAIGRLPVRAVFPDGRTIEGTGGPGAPVFRVVRPRRFFARLGKDTKIGLGEAYLAGDWAVGEETDLADLFTPFAARLTTLVPPELQRFRRVVDQAIPGHHRNTKAQARDNISAHYDLSNDLFGLFLDETMTYSSAWFERPGPYRFDDLAAAQLRKIDGVLDAAGVRAGSTVLEIGTGWGALAVRAAERGALVTSITLSTQQLQLAAERVARAGVASRVQLRLCDYRDVHGSYDAVVSVEMIEAVGYEYWPTYFSAIDRLLAQGGAACIQAILMPHERMLATRGSFGWIQKYIFPGGLIPSLQALEQAAGEHTSLRLTGSTQFGPDYGHTLRLWRQRFAGNWPRVQALGFDETFRRMWEYYLAYCEAGFRVGYLDVAQLRFTRA